MIVPEETAISPPRSASPTSIPLIFDRLLGVTDSLDWILQSTTRAQHAIQNWPVLIPCIFIVMARLHDLGIFMVYMDSHSKSSLHYHTSNGVHTSLCYKIGIEYLSPTCTCIEWVFRYINTTKLTRILLLPACAPDSTNVRSLSSFYLIFFLHCLSPPHRRLLPRAYS